MREKERVYMPTFFFFPVFVMICCIALQVAIFAWFGRAFFLLDIITYNYTCAFSRETHLYIYFCYDFSISDLDFDLSLYETVKGGHQVAKLEVGRGAKDIDVVKKPGGMGGVG